VSLTAAADLVEGNQIAVTINGVAVAPVAFAGSSEDTVKAIVAAIDMNDGIRGLGVDAFAVDGAPRSFYLSAPARTLTAGAAVSGGASQTTFAQEAYTSAKFTGVARHQELCSKEGTGFYVDGQAVSVMTRGKIYALVADGASPVDKESAYVVLTGADAGRFTDFPEGNYDCGCVFRGSKENGIALVETRGMK
jgi:hypothetical protein